MSQHHSNSFFVPILLTQDYPHHSTRESERERWVRVRERVSEREREGGRERERERTSEAFVKKILRTFRK